MPADQAAGTGSEQTVMPRVMTGDAADHRAFDTTGGLCRAGRKARCRGQKRILTDIRDKTDWNR